MSSLKAIDRRSFETFLGMSSGYVFSDYTFRDIVLENTGLDIHSDRYRAQGSSKAKMLRELWKLESDHIVGRLLLALIEYRDSLQFESTPEEKELENRCRPDCDAPII
jgi:hypothetical protein